jgi:hypothetical protein
VAIQPTRPNRVRATGAFARAATLLALIIAPRGASADAPGAKPGTDKIGVATIGPPSLPADLRIRLEDAAAAGLRASGAQVISATELSRARAAASLGACTDAVCEQRLAQITDARYWLRGTCALDTSTYRIHLELADARTGAVVAARDDTCDICTEAEAAESVNMAASALKAKLSRAAPAASPARAANTGTTASAAAAATPPPPAPEPPPTETNGANPIVSAPTDSGASERPTWQRVLPWVAFAAAAGSFAYGGYNLAIDNDPARCVEGDCRGRTESTAEWVSLFAVGTALTATGVLLLVLPSTPTQSSTPTAASSLGVSVSRRGLTLSGRF